MRIHVDTERCTGHARCWGEAPDVFELDDDGYNVTAEMDVLPEHEASALRGAANCPERAITIVDAELPAARDSH